MANDTVLVGHSALLNIRHMWLYSHMGCIKSAEVGSITFLRYSVNAIKYPDIINADLSESTTEEVLRGYDDNIFQDDSVHCHRARVRKTSHKAFKFSSFNWKECFNSYPLGSKLQSLFIGPRLAQISIKLRIFCTL